MKNPLCILIPGLGTGALDPEDVDTWPAWVCTLYVKLVERVPGVVVMVANYTDAQLPEKVIAAKAETGCDGVIFAGHSDGGAAEVWLQNHVSRLGESLVIDLMFFLDGVNDIIRHGLLAPLDPNVVLRCVRIFQTNDPFIHSQVITYANGARSVENMPTSVPPFNHPDDNHGELAEDAAVQDFIVEQVAALVEKRSFCG